MINRERGFFELRTHAWYGKLFQRLSQADKELCLEYIAANADCDLNKFVEKVNRMFLGWEKLPKNNTLIMELLTVAAQNSKEN